jgi:hypothetical protein
MQENPVGEGAAFLSHVWFTVAEQVVETAARIYELTEEQKAALKKAFLRPNDYTVEPQ